MYRTLLKKAEAFVTELFKSEASKNLTFHNLEHTREVARVVEEIAAAIDLPPIEQEILRLAAWFHDCGYLFQYVGHEEEGKKLAKAFLAEVRYPVNRLDKILACIEATKPSKTPETLTEKILCDADMSHLASEDYPSRLHDLRKEWAFFLGRAYSDEDWIKLNTGFLSEHRYFTSYGQKILEPAKRKNVRRLEQMVC